MKNIYKYSYHIEDAICHLESVHHRHTSSLNSTVNAQNMISAFNVLIHNIHHPLDHFGSISTNQRVN